ncbi:hypothetical protein KUTeg_019366, partial [Tegillarca granosa]
MDKLTKHKKAACLYKHGCLSSYVFGQFQELVLCSDATDTITCTQNVINIHYASYGRHDNRTCPGPEMMNTNCIASSSFSYVSGECDGQSSCNVQAHKDNFGGDPCYGIAKYLYVEYNCKSNDVIHSFHTDVICNNLYGTFDCAVGVIQLTYANYGRLDEHTCPYWKQLQTDCHANDSLFVVRGLCEGQTQCSLTASASSFSPDTCDTRIHRYLTVRYTCGL